MKLTSCPAVKIIRDPNVRDYYVCGDLHGMRNVLLIELKKHGFNPDLDRLICTGNLGGEGWSDYATSMLLKENWFESVLGSNEEMALKALKNPSFINHHIDNVGSWLHELNESDKGLIASLYENLPYAIEIQHKGFTYGIAHADMVGNNWGSFKDQLLGKRHFLTFMKSLCVTSDVYRHVLHNGGRFTQAPLEYKKIKGVDALFLGHNLTPRPIRRLNIFYIDTGAYLSHKITVLKLDPLTLGNEEF